MWLLKKIYSCFWHSPQIRFYGCTKLCTICHLTSLHLTIPVECPNQVNNLPNRSQVVVHLCLVMDHRWCQNVVRTRKWYMRHSLKFHWFSYHTLDLLWFITTQTHGNMESVCFIRERSKEWGRCYVWVCPPIGHK